MLIVAKFLFCTGRCRNSCTRQCRILFLYPSVLEYKGVISGKSLVLASHEAYRFIPQFWCARHVFFQKSHFCTPALPGTKKEYGTAGYKNFGNDLNKIRIWQQQVQNQSSCQILFLYPAFTSYQGCRILTAAAGLVLNEGQYKGLIAGKNMFLSNCWKNW